MTIIWAVARQKQQNDLCAQRRLCIQWVAKSTRFFMRTAKTDYTGQMPRLNCVFALHISHFVGFVMPLLTYWMKFLVYDVLFFIIPRHLCRREYSFRLFVHPFICSLVCTSVPFVELLQSFTCNQQNDLCAQQRLCTQCPGWSTSSFCAYVILLVLSCGCSHSGWST